MDRIVPEQFRNIPKNTMIAIHNWIDEGRHPSGFLTAVIQNNLLKAISQADDRNLPELRNIVLYFYNYTPANCWGSPENYANWKAYKEQH